jgi:hypothetical protein
MYNNNSQENTDLDYSEGDYQDLDDYLRYTDNGTKFEESSEEEQGSFVYLPNELWTNIIQQSGDIYELIRMYQTNQRFKNIIDDPHNLAILAEDNLLKNVKTIDELINLYNSSELMRRLWSLSPVRTQIYRLATEWLGDEGLARFSYNESFEDFLNIYNVLEEKKYIFNRNFYNKNCAKYRTHTDCAIRAIKNGLRQDALQHASVPVSSARESQMRSAFVRNNDHNYINVFDNTDIDRAFYEAISEYK